jgi:hypothetical protein
MVTITRLKVKQPNALILKMQKLPKEELGRRQT